MRVVDRAQNELARRLRRAHHEEELDSRNMLGLRIHALDIRLLVKQIGDQRLLRKGAHVSLDLQTSKAVSKIAWAFLSAAYLLSQVFKCLRTTSGT